MELLSFYVVTWFMNFVIVELKCATSTWRSEGLCMIDVVI